jgi:hypothetical protein
VLVALFYAYSRSAISTLKDQPAMRVNDGNDESLTFILAFDSDGKEPTPLGNEFPLPFSLARPIHATVREQKRDYLIDPARSMRQCAVRFLPIIPMGRFLFGGPRTRRHMAPKIY